MTVWMVSSGSYSDYSVSCAFTTRELAIAYAAARNRISVEDQGQIEDARVLPWPEERAVHRRMSREARRAADDGFRVEELELYDSLPIAEDGTTDA